MRRDQLEHAIRTACQITGQTEVIVIGSQAILGTYPEYELPHLATRSMEVDILPITEGTAVEQRPDGATVTWRDSAGELTQTVGGCVIALPAQAAAEIRVDLDAWRAEYLGSVRRGKLVTPNIALSKAPAGVRATYSMVPRAEHPFLGGFGCDHNKAPGRVPAGKGLLTLTLTNEWCERHFDDDDDRLSAVSVEAAEAFMPGIANDVEFVEISRWHQQYSPVGHYAQLRAYRALTQRLDHTVHFAGEYLSAPNLNAATASGEAAAAALSQTLR